MKNYIFEINRRFRITDILFNATCLAGVVFLIDYYDIIGTLLQNWDVVIYVAFSIFTVLCLKEIINNKLWKYIYRETITYFDKYIIVILTGDVGLLLLYTINDREYKSLFLWVLIALVLLLCFRYYSTRKLFRVESEDKTNIYNIFDLFEDRIKNEGLVLLEEKALNDKNKDLLNRKYFIDSFNDVLSKCKPKDNYVIGLIGKWGSGKSTVINLLKDRINSKKDAVIGVFEPWKYDNKLSLFIGFQSYIFEMLGQNYGSFNYKSTFKTYGKLIFGYIQKSFGLSMSDFFDIDTDNEIQRIKNDINDSVKSNHKKLIVVIDDIDRLEKEQILMVFRTVKTVFDFNNIVYVLCYDEERIHKIFENELKMDSEYLNKIIQSKIVIPRIKKDRVVEIGRKCVFNLLRAYGIEHNKDDLISNLNIIFKDMNDLREIIRYINAISVSVKCYDQIKLDIADYLALEYVKFKDLCLYNDIFDNPKMFISDDLRMNSEIEFIYLDKELEYITPYYKRIFENKEVLKNLLANVFPYVEEYRCTGKVGKDNTSNSEGHKNSIKAKKCHSGRYFNSFFTLTPTFFTELNALLDGFITKVNNGGDLITEINALCSKIHPQNHDLLFELLEMNLDRINNKIGIFDYFYDKVRLYEDTPRFASLNSRDRVEIFLASIINDLNNSDEQELCLDKVANEDLLLLDSLIYWLGTAKYAGKDSKIYSYGKDIMREQLKKYIDSNTNIFDKGIYKKHLCWLFNKHLDNSTSQVKEYLSGLINKENVFRVIAECIVTWVGDGIRFEYDQTKAEALFDLNKIQEVLNNVDYPLNEDQEKVKRLYDSRDIELDIDEIDFCNL